MEPSSNFSYHVLKTLQQKSDRPILVSNSIGQNLVFKAFISNIHKENCVIIKPQPATLQVVNNQCVTRIQFHEKVTTAINLLKWKGVTPNDRVLMTISPSVDFYAVSIAVMAVGRWAELQLGGRS